MSADGAALQSTDAACYFRYGAFAPHDGKTLQDQ